MDVRIAHCLIDFVHRHGSRSVTVGDVLSDARIEQDGLLADETQLTSPPLKVQR